MLEIIGIILLCNVNKKNAVARGQTPGKYIAFTVLLWLGLELTGFSIGMLAQMSTFGAYLLAFVFVGMGAFLSYRLAQGNAPPAFAPAAVHLAAAPVVQPMSAALPADAAPQLCTSCGQPLQAGAVFCSKCGTKTERTTPAAPAGQDESGDV